MVPPVEPEPVTPGGALSPFEPLLLLRSMIAVQLGPAKTLMRAVAHTPHRIWDWSSLLMALWLLTVGRLGERTAADATPPIRHLQMAGLRLLLLTT